MKKILESLGLDFKVEARQGGEKITVSLHNGFELSAIRFDGTYGSEQGLWECAAVKNGHVSYDTDTFGADVVGWQTELNVVGLIDKLNEELHEKFNR